MFIRWPYRAVTIAVPKGLFAGIDRSKPTFRPASSSSSMGDEQALSEQRIAEVLRTKFSEEEGSMVQVEDRSGGCGAMFHVRVESPQFKGLTRINQHKMINQLLRSEIKNMHAITIDTKPLG